MRFRWPNENEEKRKRFDSIYILHDQQSSFNLRCMNQKFQPKKKKEHNFFNKI